MKGGEMVVAVRVVKGVTYVSKSTLPDEVRACEMYFTPPGYIKFFDTPTEPTDVDEWLAPWMTPHQRVHIAVIAEWTDRLPRIFFCMLHPQVQKIRRVGINDHFGLYSQLMRNGMRPNQLRDLLGKELDRNAFYRAFRDIEKTLSNRQRASFLQVRWPCRNPFSRGLSVRQGCLDLCVNTLVMHPRESATITNYLLSPIGPIDRCVLAVCGRPLSTAPELKARRSSRIMVAYNGIDLTPYSYKVIQETKYPPKPQVLYNLKASRHRKRYFGDGARPPIVAPCTHTGSAEATVTPGKEKNASPSNGTIFVAAMATRTSREVDPPLGDNATALFMAMEVRPLFWGGVSVAHPRTQVSPTVATTDANSGQNCRCRVRPHFDGVHYLCSPGLCRCC